MSYTSLYRIGVNQPIQTSLLETQSTDSDWAELGLGVAHVYTYMHRRYVAQDAGNDKLMN
jgi:hypothetical protein